MTDLRFDPFDFVFRPKAVIGESKTIEFFPAINRTGFFCDETPIKKGAFVLSVNGTPFSEVPFSVEPSATFFRVSYGNEKARASVGFVEVEPARAGEIAIFNYTGAGVNLNASFRSDARKNFERSIKTGGAVGVNSLFAGIGVSSGFLSGGGQKLRTGAAVDGTDALNKSGVLAANISPRIIRLNGSGIWVPGDDVTHFLVCLIGRGGDGRKPPSAGNGGGGGGGGAFILASVPRTAPEYGYEIKSNVNSLNYGYTKFNSRFDFSYPLTLTANNGKHSADGRGGGLANVSAPTPHPSFVAHSLSGESGVAGTTSPTTPILGGRGGRAGSMVRWVEYRLIKPDIERREGLFFSGAGGDGAVDNDPASPAGYFGGGGGGGSDSVTDNSTPGTAGLLLIIC